MDGLGAPQTHTGHLVRLQIARCEEQVKDGQEMAGGIKSFGSFSISISWFLLVASLSQAKTTVTLVRDGWVSLVFKGT